MKIIYIVGKSSVGKDTIYQILKKKMDIKNANYQEIKQDMDNIIVKAKLNSNKENIWKKYLLVS